MARSLEQPRSFTTRNIHIYHDDGRILGGVFQNGSITGANLYFMCPVFLVLPPHSSWGLFKLNIDGSTGPLLPQDQTMVSAGYYCVLNINGTRIDASITSDNAMRRVRSQAGSSDRMSTKQRHFRRTLIERDIVCAISGLHGPPYDPFSHLEPAHVFPVARENEWNINDYTAWITDTASPEHIGQNKLYSPQNGLLLYLDVHYSFIRYELAINPDDGYKVTVFINNTGSPINPDGKVLRASATNSEDYRHVNDEVLRWHFRQAILCNMKGVAGEARWDFHFDGGLEDIMDGPDSAERMEVELFTRLG